jgi:hypothetical protein
LGVLPQSAFASSCTGQVQASPDNITYSLNIASAKLSSRFTQVGNKSLQSVWVYSDPTTGVAPQYLLELRDDSAGLPGPTVLASQPFIPVSGGWNTISFGSSPALTGGVVYHAVVSYLSGTINGSNYSSFRYAFESVQTIPLDQSYAPQFNLLAFNGASWTTYGDPALVLQYTDTSYWGDPYVEPYVDGVYGTNLARQVFTADATCPIDHMDLNAQLFNSAPGADLRYDLYDASTGVTLASGTVLTNGAGSGLPTWNPVNFSAVTLQAGDTYYVTYSCPICVDGLHCYYGVGPYEGNSPPAAIQALSWQGTSGRREVSLNNGASWTAYPDRDFGMRFSYTGASPTFTRTVSPTWTASPVVTPTPTRTISATFSASPSFSVSPTFTPSPSISPTFTPLPTATAIPFIDNFEAGAPAWNATGLWHLVDTGSANPYAMANSPTHSFWYGQDGTGTYDTGVANAGTLSGPILFIPAGAVTPELHFNSWYQTESSSALYDQRWVRISVNGGAFVNLTQFSLDAMNAWTPKLVSLSAYKGSNIQLQFYFDTVDSTSNAYRGWYVDDVVVADFSGSPTFSPSFSPSFSASPTWTASPIVTPTSTRTVTPTLTISPTPTPFSLTDAFGYNASSSAFAWDDAVAGGTNITASLSGGVDDGRFSAALPFTFRYYGANYASVGVVSNGYLQFGGSNTDYTPNCLNSNGVPLGIVAGFFQDLNITSGGIYTKTLGVSPNRVFVVEYYQVPLYNGAGNVTFEFELFEGSNQIKVNYLSVSGPTGLDANGGHAVVGLRSWFDCANRTGLSVSCLAPNLADGECVVYTYPGSEPACITFTNTPSPSVSPTQSASPTISPTFSISPTWSASPTITPSPTISPTFTLLPTPVPFPFSDSFESGAPLWSPAGLWHMVDTGSANSYALASSPTHSFWYGQDSTGTYDTAGLANSGTLTGPAIAVPAGATTPELHFNSWYQTESSGTIYDQRWIRISVNGGAFGNLTQFSLDTMSTWLPKVLSLSAYKGSTIQLQFYFNTIDSGANAFRGWYVDDVVVADFANTLTPSPSSTPSPTPTGTSSATLTPSATTTVSPSFTSTPTPSASLTGTPTVTVTSSSSSTVTPTGTPTPTDTSTATGTATSTRSPTGTPSDTPTGTATATVTPTPSSSATLTASATTTCTATPTASLTGTFTATGTDTRTTTASSSATSTSTATPSATGSSTPTSTRTASPSPSFSRTVTLSATPSATLSATATLTPSSSATLSATSTATATVSLSRTQSPTPSRSPTPSGTCTATPYLSPTSTGTISPTFTVSPTWTLSDTPAPTGTAVVPAVLDRNIFRPGQGVPLAITFKAPEAGRVTVHVFNVAGEKVRAPFESDVPADQWINAAWDGTNDAGEKVGSGVYFVSIQGAGIKRVMKVVLLK